MHNLKYCYVDVMTDIIGHMSLPVVNPSLAQRNLLKGESQKTLEMENILDII